MQKQRNVFIIKGAGFSDIINMFMEHGWNIVNDIYDADLVQFCGGEDVSPELYGQHKHDRTRDNPDRDKEEARIYHLALSLGLPMAGICRGGQFLNVMNGGSLYQDVDNHAIQGTHPAFILGGLIPVQVSSTHHQMMRPNHSPYVDCHLLMTADEATTRKHMSDIIGSGAAYEIETKKSSGGYHSEDVEAVYYGNTNCLCFQPHPEFKGPLYEECRKVYFNFIEQYLFDTDLEQDQVL